jgi:zinc D-Ala-D-Ala carboxypeptidase
LGWQGHRGYRRQRDTRIPTVLLVFACGIAIWVLFGPRSLATGGLGATPTSTTGVAIATGASFSPEPLPACGVGAIPAWHSQYADWQITLLDTTYQVSRSYVPPDLVPITQAGFDGAGQLRAFVIDDLRQLKSAALADGVDLSINSAYRSYNDQASTYAQAQASFGPTLAALAAAQPGHSEHQLGTAIDFDVDTAKQAWLQTNAWKFGFISSFPIDTSPAFTCYKYEPWHYRYVGRDTAASIHNSGLTIREWIWQNAPPPPGYGATPTPVRTPTPLPTPSGLPGEATGGQSTPQPTPVPTPSPPPPPPSSSGPALPTPSPGASYVGD